MNIVVVGAGIAGVCTAWYLTKAGHQVTVVEALSEVAQETSFANAGMLTQGYAAPWAAPNVVKQSWKMLREPSKPLCIKPDGSLEQVKWLWKMYGYCNAEDFSRNRQHMYQLGKRNLQLLHQLKNELALDYAGRAQGTLEVFRASGDYQACVDDTDFLNQQGIAHVLLEPQNCNEFEPAIATDQFSGALRLNEDETGDCHLFAQQLKQYCEQFGVKFLFEHAVSAILNDGQSVTGVVAAGKTLLADHVVLTTGCQTKRLLQSIGLDAMIYPVKGYSITVPIKDESRAPQSTILDYQYKVAITRMGDHIRVGGIAEISGWDKIKISHNEETLKMVLNDLFPGSADLEETQFWMGMRPMTPDGPPLIGRMPLAGLSVNAGHGTFGWTFGLAAAKLLQESLSVDYAVQKQSPFYPSRYQA
ncbi:D-amino acid dehydrogenase [Vitreoscilla stercoraria]|uniref:D-amino acid dehydrogenase n=1 Tax=Vitreoscilla stercoraria TaxID=61 RepID=A0ABY4EA56_VITST|nr:D-amino acid dehydrogenase [Vitreoscilla stercoraria]UOO92650.1 D-amino acid dehydrogenase [Vitreoscilla stercoraria]